MKTQLNRDLIESLSESDNIEFCENVNSFVQELVSKAVGDISLKSPFIKPEKCCFLPVNESYLGIFTQLSEFTYFLGVENPQIEYNSQSKKNLWKIFWREFRASFRLGKKKYKKNKVDVSHEPAEKYKFSDFKHDLVKFMANYLSSTSIVYEYLDHISIVGKDDFGTNVKIKIYICAYNSKTKHFKMYNENKNKFFDVDFGSRYANLNEKIGSCGSMVVEMIKLINAIYSKAYNKVPNQILVESLVYNCPKLLFDEKDVFKTFVNVINYINLSNPRALCSICDTSKNIFEEPLIIKANEQVEYNRIVSMFGRFSY